MTSIADRILNKIVESDTFFNGSPCWVWTGGTNGNGYGRCGTGSMKDGSRRNNYTHRLMYEALVGPIPEGLHIDHLCRVTLCCNPAHLEPVTRSQNVRRGMAPTSTRARYAAITECPQGHPYSGDNLYISPTDGSRACRECVRGSVRRYQARRRAEAKGAAA